MIHWFSTTPEQPTNYQSYDMAHRIFWARCISTSSTIGFCSSRPAARTYFWSLRTQCIRYLQWASPNATLHGTDWCSIAKGSAPSNILPLSYLCEHMLCSTHLPYHSLPFSESQVEVINSRCLVSSSTPRLLDCYSASCYISHWNAATLWSTTSSFIL